jgi:molecular chaperone DnaJ
MRKDFYEVLGVARTATDAEIKSAYRTLAKRYHPDVNKEPDAEDRFKEVGEAYDVLSDADKRRKYDQVGHAEQGGPPPPGDDFGFGFPFGDIFKQARTRAEKPTRQNSDYHHTVEVSVVDLFKPQNLSVDYRRKVFCSPCSGIGGTGEQPCPSCHGQGVVSQTFQVTAVFSTSRMMPCTRCNTRGRIFEKPCAVCHGDGHSLQVQHVDFTLPLGSPFGDVHVQGMGNCEYPRMNPGDLIVHTRIKHHPEVEIRPEDGTVLLSKHIDVIECLLGQVQKKVITPWGEEIDFQIPRACPDGWVYTKHGGGLPRGPEPGNRSHLLVRVLYKFPKSLTAEQERLLKEYVSTLNVGGKEND